MTPPDPPAGAGHEEARREHGTGTNLGDLTLSARIFLSIGTGIGVMSAIYWFTSYEEAGSIMLLLASVLVLACGTYFRHEDRRRSPASEPGAAEPEHYLPHASPWPFGVGASVFLVANGLILGPAFMVPGAVLLVGSITGFLLQSRYRS
jgi:hypothetical protein